MPRRLFPFLQAELPFELGPSDGRRALRDGASGEVQSIVVLSTAGARRAVAGRRGAGRGWRRAASPGSEPPSVPVTHATVIDPAAFAAEQEAERWLAAVDAEHEAQKAFAAVNRLLRAYRVAAADVHACELTPSQALMLRAGFGEGEQVADGRWLQARELAWPPAAGGRGRRRASLHGAAREERLAALLAGRESELLCEDLTLRARGDLDGGRLAHAAIQLERAYAAASVELPGQRGAEMERRVDELASLREGILRQSEAAIAAADPPERSGDGRPAAQLQEETLRHALVRLESALRARGA